MVQGHNWFYIENDGRWAPFAGQWWTIDVPEKRITIKEDGILVQPNAMYVPQLVYLVSMRLWKPTILSLQLKQRHRMVSRLHCFAPVLGFYIAMDRPNIQFAVKTLSSYMFRTSMKVLAALKHLTSYSDGMPDRGILLKVTEEGKSLSNFWREHDLVQSEATIPKRPSKSHFTL